MSLETTAMALVAPGYATTEPKVVTGSILVTYSPDTTGGFGDEI